MKKQLLLSALLLLLALGGCASVTFRELPADYEDPKKGIPHNVKGIEFRYAEPYLLISLGEKKGDAAKGGGPAPLKYEFIYFPSARKVIAELNNGWGSAEYSLTIENGILTGFGAKNDSGGAATIAAIGSLAAFAKLKAGQDGYPRLYKMVFKEGAKISFTRVSIDLSK